MKNKWVIIPIIVLMSVFFAACSGNEDVGLGNGERSVEIINLPDERKVTCVFAGDSYKSGVSCDWESIAPKD